MMGDAENIWLVEGNDGTIDAGREIPGGIFRSIGRTVCDKEPEAMIRKSTPITESY